MIKKATLGEHNWKKKKDGNLAELKVKVKKIIVHPDFDKVTVNNDITILYLAKGDISRLYDKRAPAMREIIMLLF